MDAGKRGGRDWAAFPAFVASDGAALRRLRPPGFNRGRKVRPPAFSPSPWLVERGTRYWIGPVHAPGERVDSIAVAYRADDARLIAAAPDLLAALEAFVDSDNEDSIDTRYENARRAIAKATGGETDT